MFDNIGGKIKALAKILCWIGIIGSIIGGIVIIRAGNAVSSYSSYYGSSASSSSSGVLGVLTMILGSLLSWIGSFFTYGFGQLIEDTQAIHSILYSAKSDQQVSTNTPSKQVTESEKSKILSDGGWVCNSCGRVNHSYVSSCVSCGTKKKDA